MKNQFINEIKAGASVEDVFILADKTISQKRDGNNYLSIVLSDKTGQIKGVVWDDVEEIVSKVNSGDYVKIEGQVSEYRGVLQVVVKRLSRIENDAVDPGDYIPATEKNIEDLFERFTKINDFVQNPFLKRLIEAFLSDEEFVRAFKIAPAAKKMHHAYLGGLLEHSLSVARLAYSVGKLYDSIDMDMLLTGAMLHDIGKIEEFNYTNQIDYSDAGRFLNHIVIGCEMLQEKIREIDDFPPKLSLMLKHMIVSHHGSREFGSPEPPKTVEAVILNYIDEIDAKVNGIRHFVAKDHSDSSWSGYHRLLERHFYKGGVEDLPTDETG